MRLFKINMGYNLSMKHALKIWKPGSDLVRLLGQDGDTTRFGGLNELRYFVKYLGAVPVSSISDILADDIVLVSNCGPQFHGEARGLKSGKVIQIVSDLNLTIPDELLGNHIKFCQIPYPKDKDWHYSSIEKAILLFQKQNRNSQRQYTLVYGGGARNGNRDKQYVEFLSPSKKYVSLLFTSSEIFDESVKIKDKITFNELQKVYSQTKYGIVISDPQYYETGMLTQRYWEYCLSGMITFVYEKYDKFNAIIASDDFARVKDSKELEEKIDYLDMHPEAKRQIFFKQSQMINKEITFMKGENIISLKELIFGDLE